MIEITREKNKIVFHGHTEPAVCAACSSIMYTTVNFIYKYNKKSIGFIDDKLLDKVIIIINEHDNIIDIAINNMIDMLECLRDDGNITKIKIKNID